MTQRDKWAKRPAVTRYWTQCDLLRTQAAKVGWSVPEQLSIDFYIPMPVSWSIKKKKLYSYEPHRSTPDLDNLIKAFLDAFGQDKQVHLVYASKQWTPEQEGVIVVREYEGEKVLPDYREKE